MALSLSFLKSLTSFLFEPILRPAYLLGLCVCIVTGSILTVVSGLMWMTEKHFSASPSVVGWRRGRKSNRCFTDDVAFQSVKEQFLRGQKMSSSEPWYIALSG